MSTFVQKLVESAIRCMVGSSFKMYASRKKNLLKVKRLERKVVQGKTIYVQVLVGKMGFCPSISVKNVFSSRSGEELRR